MGAEEGRRRSGNSGQSGSDRKGRILVFMFPDRFERWLDHDRSNLPVVKGSQTHVAPERFGGIGLGLQGRQRAFLAEAVDVHLSILKRGGWTDAQLAKMEIVAAAEKRPPLRSFGAATGEPSQTGTVRIIVVVAAVDCSIEKNSMVVPGRVQPASSTIDIDMATWLKRRPGMRIVAHHADNELIGDAVIDPQADRAGREAVAPGIRIAVHADEITRSHDPHAPMVFWSGLKSRLHQPSGGFSVGVGSAFQIHRGAVNLHVGTEPAESVSDSV